MAGLPLRWALPLRVALVGSDQPWIGDYCRRLMQRNFVEDQDIHTPEAVAQVLAALGLSADDLIALAQSDAIKRKLRENTEIAQALGVFGAPTFFTRGEMFWGNDRLDDALVYAVQQRQP